VRDCDDQRDDDGDCNESSNDLFSKSLVAHHVASEFRISQPCFSFSSVVA
jgi:hypothetical protein